MYAVQGHIDATPATVFGVLADGWSYPNWVVGVTHTRNIDVHWPAVGARVHHTLGVWPLTRENDAEVVEVDFGRRLVLAIRLGAPGTMRVELTVQPSATGCTVSLLERPESGPIRFFPGPLLSRLLTARNAESLRRLRTVAETRVGREDHTTGTERAHG